MEITWYILTMEPEVFHLVQLGIPERIVYLSIILSNKILMGKKKTKKTASLIFKNSKNDIRNIFLKKYILFFSIQ